MYYLYSLIFKFVCDKNKLVTFYLFVSCSKNAFQAIHPIVFGWFLFVKCKFSPASLYLNECYKKYTLNKMQL